MSSERRHFRIDIEALVRIRKLNTQQAMELATEIKSGSPLGSHLDSQTLKINKQIQDGIAAIASTNMQLGHLLELMNKKVNLLLEELHEQKELNAQEGEPVTRRIPINISGGGALIYSNENYEEQSLLDIRITFLPEHIAVRSVARVIKCFNAEEGDPNGIWRVALEFTEMHEEDQDRVVRKVLQEQTRQLRQKRRQEQSESD